ncbi:MAG TPA: esterase-like activity of phytase family protein [Gemmatimonadales bacterium]|nr:esterase-like activity of phytase family protein [Gemmatimonadales bacterium]
MRARPSSRAAFALVLAVGCTRPGLVEGPLSNPTVMTSMGAGDSAVPVINGGYGSALAVDPHDRAAVYLLTDRGPNVAAAESGQKVFPVPAFAPRIGRFRIRDGVLVLEDTIVLRAHDGVRLSGLAQPPGPGSTNEVAVGPDGALLGRGGFDPNGFDPEGLVRLPDGSFWVSDEYGPYLLQVDPSGRERARVSPFGGARPLPAVLGRRRPNCGMEGLTILPNGGTLAGIMQCALDNPPPGGRHNRLTRLLLYDTRTGLSRQYLHLLDHDTYLNSEIAALDSHRFLVIERDLRWPGQPGAFKRIHLIDIGGATDVTGEPAAPGGRLTGGKTLEELTAGAVDPAAVLARHGVRVASKHLVADLVTDLRGWSHDKPEGLAVLDDSTVLVSNDDDFGVTSSDPAGRVRRKTNPVTGRPDFAEVRAVRLRPRPPSR